MQQATGQSIMAGDAAPGTASTATSAGGKRLGSLARMAQRYLVPRTLGALWISIRDRVLVSTTARVQLSNDIRFGRGTVIKTYAVIQSSGGRIRFGRGCEIGSFNYIATGDVDIIAGDHVHIGPNVTIVATTRGYKRRDKLISEQGYADKGIRIGNDVLISSNCALVDGCDIGDGAIIGAGSVVKGKIPPYAVVFGTKAEPRFYRE